MLAGYYFDGRIYEKTAKGYGKLLINHDLLKVEETKLSVDGATAEISGIIDFFPIYNDNRISLVDYPVSKDIRWIMDNTPANSVFLNSQYLYDPVSLAGRKIFLGWPYFPWSAGYDTQTRDDLRKKLLNSDNLNS